MDARLSGPRQPKEKRNIPPLHAHIRRRMQTKLSKLNRLQIMHYTKNALLHLARIFRAQNNHLHPLEIDLHGGSGGHTGGEAVSGELAGVVDDEIGVAECFEFSLCRTDEHVVHEEGVVGSGADDADFDAVLGVPLRASIGE